MGRLGILFLGSADNDRISEIAKEKGIDRAIVEVEYKEMLKKLDEAKCA